ncbi:MAG: CpsB/CapC family capsule biosynthesis tyrosine phosphatase [Faecalibacterium sp.]
MIDFHSHILPNMDDGSKSLETSYAMLQAMAAMGVDTVCATSHYYIRENDISAFCCRRLQAMIQLSAALPKGMPAILPAAEVAYFSHMEEYDLTRLCIENTRTLLLEMPFSEWTELQLETVTSLVLDLHYQVVLVHPERFCFSKNNRDKLKKLAELPLAMQINAGSLIQWHTRRHSLDLLQMTETPLLGSDCHNTTTRPPNLKGGRNIVEKKLGSAFLKQMDENAVRLIEPCSVKV